MNTAKENKKEEKKKGSEAEYRRVLNLLANEMDTVHTNGGYVTITIQVTISRKDYEIMMDA